MTNQYCDFKGNKIGDRGAFMLSDALKANQSLNALSLSGELQVKPH